MYFDTSYIAKLYFDEPDSSKVGDLALGAPVLYASQLALVEFHTVIHRRLREGLVSPGKAREVASQFSKNIEGGFWKLIPLSETLLRTTAALVLSAPDDLFLRAGDAIHLATAQTAGEREVWTNDRHMLAAASYFGLKGRSV